ncbi:hypothetical protein HOP50_02g16580 [Chloropicon primus]|uniref:Ycf20-like protein n=1 Tax=Chloropicon primus TaxID=1764295 RepID=A0A5B8MG17_9CHLO|nr:hypothetical protein A3770_02p16620 [Chloropicon primus]UPQ98352.1 hypothetical protein HOP50_02g16580 [Chloropicon primus]|eukprot:QDZ19144.1 hypothetical protein A3770_02p16620 [Chloropicon primus]
MQARTVGRGGVRGEGRRARGGGTPSSCSCSRVNGRGPRPAIAGGRSGRGGKKSSPLRLFAASNEPEVPTTEDGASGPGLIKALLNAQPLAERYFERKWWRKPMWYFIIFGFAYFAANTISLSFGAKAVNDVVASVLVVIFYEASSRVVYKAKKRTVWHWLLHYFKLGTVVGFLMDSYKLGG